MPISGCHDLPLATFNLPSRNRSQNKRNNTAQLNLCRSQAPLGNASREALLRIPAPATTLRDTQQRPTKPKTPRPAGPPAIRSVWTLRVQPSLREQTQIYERLLLFSFTHFTAFAKCFAQTVRLLSSN